MKVKLFNDYAYRRSVNGATYFGSHVGIIFCNPFLFYFL